MLRFYLTAALALPIPLVAQVAETSVDFCPRANTMPKAGHLAVYDKEVNDIRYVIAIASVHTLERMRDTSMDASLEARRKIAGYVEGRAVNSSEDVSEQFRFYELETYRLSCFGMPVVLFVQDRRKLERLNQSLRLSKDATQRKQPDPLKSAEENLMDALRNKR